MINLPDYIIESNIDYILHRLKDIASIRLKNILNEYYMDLGIKNKKDIQYLSFKESLSIILTGFYTQPVFELRFNIYNENEFYIGYYQYLTEFDFTYVDEFFVAKW